MKPTLCASFLTLALIGFGVADVPRQAPLSKYQKLWTESPFTAKPLAVNRGPVFNPLENYVLLGVAPIREGYRVTIMNKRTPTDPRIVVKTGQPSQGFRLIEVVEDKQNPGNTTVRMASGTTEGVVRFEEKFLALKAAPQPTPKPSVSVTINNATNGAKKPRPRVIQPPSTNNQKSSTRSQRRNR